jgi:filamentous hemagglutinin
MPKKRPKNVGAGGYWNVIDEKLDVSVIRQATPFSCVAAVGAMLLQNRGISMTQEAIIDIIGESSSTESLATMLNQIDAIDDTRWYGGFVAVHNLEKIGASGQFGAVFREGRPLGHLVLVRNLSEDLIHISDPWEGTIYKMTVNEFLAVWDGEVVFRWNSLT